MDEKDQKVLERVESEIKKIDKKENKIIFFVVDTKGIASGSLEYIYKMAKAIKDAGYDVLMLHQEEYKDFVGVEEWLGKEYAELPHKFANDNVSVSASDIFFIPEIYTNIMKTAMRLPCKKIVICQNHDYLTEFIPIGEQLSDYRIMDVLANTQQEADVIKSYFPYLRSNVVTPNIDKQFFKSDEPKNLYVNIVSNDETCIHKIVKPFYWKYPQFRWVSFRDIRGVSKEEIANAFRESAITIWVDERTRFGYTPLEALASGNIVIAKVPEKASEWMKVGEEGELTPAVLWFRDYDELHEIIAASVRAWTKDSVPSEIAAEAPKLLEKYTDGNFDKNVVEYVSGMLANRKAEMEDVIKKIKEKK